MAIDAQLQRLVEAPTERSEVELKGWLNLTENGPRATLAKGIIALANHGGGFLIFGFESDGSPSPARPPNLAAHTQDAVNDSIERFADPAFHCNVHIVRRLADGLEYPVVVVPGGHKVPIRSKRTGPANEIIQDRYYVRRPGPASEPPQGAHEWNELLERCMANRRDEITEVMRSLLDGRTPKPEVPPDAAAPLRAWETESLARWGEVVARRAADAPQRMPLGYYTFSCLIEGVRIGIRDLERAILAANQIQLTGWTPWLWPHVEGIRPYVNGHAIECNIGNLDNADPPHSDFWRISQTGGMFLVRGYSEDGNIAPNVRPGTVIDLTLPVWRIGECLLFVERFAGALGLAHAVVQIRCTFTGLNGRKLVSIDGRRHLRDDRISYSDAIETKISVTASQISDRLPDLVRELTEPVYLLFDFYTPPPAMYADELGRMQRRQF